MRRDELLHFRRVLLLLLFTVCVPALALSTFGVLAIVNERAAVERDLRETYGDKLQRLAPYAADDASLREAARRFFPEDRAVFERLSDGEMGLRELLASLGEELGPPVAELPRPDGTLLVARLPAGDSPARVALWNQVLYVVLLLIFYAAIAVGVVLTSRAALQESRLSRLKSDFVSHVSHELRTPLTSIRMFVETLRLGRFSTDSEREEFLRHLDQETERLASLVDRLLDWARIESGRKIYRKSRVDPADLAKNALAVFHRQRLTSEVKVELELQPGLPPVHVDAEALEVVLLNLLLNAWKYTGPEKEIRLRARAAGKGVALDVVDNGPGITRAERKRIFEQFYRIDDLLNRRTEGTGLGLAISKRIVEEHEGRIEVGGEPGRGSVFTVVLPPAREAMA